MTRLVVLLSVTVLATVLIGGCKSTSIEKNARRYESTRLAIEAIPYFREQWAANRVPGLPAGGVIQTELQGFLPQVQVQFPHIVTLKITRPSEPDAVYYYVLSMQTAQSNWQLIAGEKTDLAGNRLRKYKVR